MNSFDNCGANPTGWPAPIVNDEQVPPDDDGHFIVTLAEQRDTFDLATGQCHIARTMNGACYDTQESVLIASTGTRDAATGYSLRRLYVTACGYWFVLRLEWWNTFGLWDDEIIKPIPASRALAVARALVPEPDSYRFLFDWYGGSWMPRDDAFARSWAERSLSGTDLESVLAEIATLSPNR